VNALHSQEEDVQVLNQQHKDSSHDAAIARAMENFLLSERAQLLFSQLISTAVTAALTPWNTELASLKTENDKLKMRMINYG